MHPLPEQPPIEAATDVLDGGHLWLLELIDGLPCRFRLGSDGVVRFADGERPFDGDDPPLGYGAAVREVRERLNRRALRAAVDDVEAVTFVGVAPVRRSLAYDWDRTPAFLGIDVLNGDDGEVLAPDRAEAAYERLGVTPVNALRKEVRAADFDPDAYDPPASTWRAGPPFGTLIRNKGGGRAVVRRDPDSGVDDPGATDAATVVASFVEDGGLDRAGATGAKGRSGEPGSFERAWEALTRERYRRFVGHDAVDRTAAREALATATGRRADG